MSQPTTISKPNTSVEYINKMKTLTSLLAHSPYLPGAAALFLLARSLSPVDEQLPPSGPFFSLWSLSLHHLPLCLANG
jgi:hypothetical protein